MLSIEFHSVHFVSLAGASAARTSPGLTIRPDRLLEINRSVITCACLGRRSVPLPLPLALLGGLITAPGKVKCCCRDALDEFIENRKFLRTN